MIAAEAILAAVETIYDAALHPQGSDEGLAAVRGLIGADHAVLLTQAADGPATGSGVGVDGGLLGRLAEAAGEGGIAADWLRAIPARQAIASSHIVADDDFLRSPMFNEIVRPMNGFRAGLFAWHGRSRSRYVAICRPQGSADFASGEVRALQYVMPHFAAAQRLRRRLGDACPQEMEIWPVLDALDQGVILVDATCRPHFVNRRAAEIGRQWLGLKIAAAGISGVSPSETAMLRQLVSAVAAMGAGPGPDAGTAMIRATTAATARLCLSHPEGGSPLVLTVVPVMALGPSGHHGGPSRVAIFIAAPEAPPGMDERAIIDAFDLTPREAATAARLATGATIAEIADGWGIGASTIRGYVKTIFEKTGTHRQADLVRLLLQGFTAP